MVYCDLHAGRILLEADRVEIIDFDLGFSGWGVMDFAMRRLVHSFPPSLAGPGGTPQLGGATP